MTTKPDLNKLTKAQLLEHIEQLEQQASGEPTVTGEYPVGWHCKYKTPEGLEANLFVRGYTGNDVLTDAKKAMAWLGEQGAQPWDYGRGSNGSKQADTQICPIHQVPMKQFSKNGSTWYSHRAVKEDGTEYWCKGKQEAA